MREPKGYIGHVVAEMSSRQVGISIIQSGGDTLVVASESKDAKGCDALMVPKDLQKSDGENTSTVLTSQRTINSKVQRAARRKVGEERSELCLLLQRKHRLPAGNHQDAEGLLSPRNGLLKIL